MVQGLCVLVTAIEEEAESKGKEEDVKLLSISGKHSAQKVVASFTLKKVKLAATEDVGEDDNDDDYKDMMILMMKTMKKLNLKNLYEML